MGAAKVFTTEASGGQQPAEIVQPERDLLGVFVPGALTADRVPGSGAQDSELLQHEGAEAG